MVRKGPEICIKAHMVVVWHLKNAMVFMKIFQGLSFNQGIFYNIFQENHRGSILQVSFYNTFLQEPIDIYLEKF